jgi:hypothetical protein
MLRFGTALAQGDEGLNNYITHHGQEAGWKTDLLMQAIMTPTDVYASEIVQVRMPVLSKGRFVLVGDAGTRLDLQGENKSCIGRRVLVSCED